MIVEVKANNISWAVDGVRAALAGGPYESICTSYANNVMFDFVCHEEHYMEYGDTEQEVHTRVTQFANLFTIQMKDILPIFDNVTGLPKFTTEDVNHSEYTNGMNGMSEDSPINATLGSITTPNSKSKSEGSGERDETHTSAYRKERYVQLVGSGEYSLYKLMEKQLSKLIYEHNTIL